MKPIGQPLELLCGTRQEIIPLTVGKRPCGRLHPKALNYAIARLEFEIKRLAECPDSVLDSDLIFDIYGHPANV